MDRKPSRWERILSTLGLLYFNGMIISLVCFKVQFCRGHDAWEWIIVGNPQCLGKALVWPLFIF